MFIGRPEDYSQAFLVMDCRVVFEVKSNDIPITLMGAFFVFNICYPPGCKNYYSLLEVVVLNYPIGKSSSSVKHLYSSLTN